MHPCEILGYWDHYWAIYSRLKNPYFTPFWPPKTCNPFLTHKGSPQGWVPCTIAHTWGWLISWDKKLRRWKYFFWTRLFFYQTLAVKWFAIRNTSKFVTTSGDELVTNCEVCLYSNLSTFFLSHISETKSMNDIHAKYLAAGKKYLFYKMVGLHLERSLFNTRLEYHKP